MGYSVNSQALRKIYDALTKCGKDIILNNNMELFYEQE